MPDPALRTASARRTESGLGPYNQESAHIGLVLLLFVLCLNPSSDEFAESLRRNTSRSLPRRR